MTGDRSNPRQILCLAGDGIGPEIMAATVQVLDAITPILGRPVVLSHAEIGFPALDKSGSTIPQAVIDQALASDGVILGPVSHNAYPPVAEGGLNPSGVLRKAMDLHANIRPAKSFDGIDSATGKPLDLIVMRENLEGFYADRNLYEGNGEFMPTEGVALAIRRITRTASLNIARTAFEWADARKAQHVTAVHKANVMRMSDGLFLDSVRAVAAEYPHITYDEILVDAAAALLVRDAARFDVIVTTNMFGDILSDLAAELSGGLGLGGSLNAGGAHAVAQAQHGSAPDIAGEDKANPVSLILSTAMLLRHLGEGNAAARIEQAVDKLLANAETRTMDVGGLIGCTAFTQLLCQTITEMEKS